MTPSTFFFFFFRIFPGGAGFFSLSFSLRENLYEKKPAPQLQPFSHQPPYTNHHPSPITHHPSPITHHPSPITHHPSTITRHPSPVTRHPSPVTRHPSPVTHHPLSITHHPSPIIMYCHVLMYSCTYPHTLLPLLSFSLLPHSSPPLSFSP